MVFSLCWINSRSGEERERWSLLCQNTTVRMWEWIWGFGGKRARKQYTEWLQKISQRKRNNGLGFQCSNILPNCPADSAKLLSAIVELGRQWNDKNWVNSTSFQTTSPTATLYPPCRRLPCRWPSAPRSRRRTSPWAAGPPCHWRPGWQFNRIFWPIKSWPKSSPNSSPTRSHSSLGHRPSLGGLLGGLKILLNCHPAKMLHRACRLGWPSPWTSSWSGTASTCPPPQPPSQSRRPPSLEWRCWYSPSKPYLQDGGEAQPSDWTFPSSEGPRIGQLEGAFWMFLTKSRGQTKTFFSAFLVCNRKWLWPEISIILP